MLGGLAKALRMLGYDTIYWRGEGDKLLDWARREGRIILTRRRGLLKYKGDLRIFLISRDNPREQLDELIKEVPLDLERLQPLSRCLCCNRAIVPVGKEDVEHRVPDHIYQSHREFSTCTNCKRIYWKGTHRSHMEGTIQRLVEEWRIRYRSPKGRL